MSDPLETSDLPDFSDESDASPAAESEPPPPDGSSTRWVVPVGTALIGTAVIVFLTRYNMSGERYGVNHYLRALPRSWEEYLLVNITGLTLFPFLLIFGGFRQRAEEFGFRPAVPPAAKLAVGFYALMLPVLYFASRQPQFFQFYPMQSRAGEDWTFFLYHQLTYGMYFFCWEFFYRGFLTFGLAKGIGFPAAIVAQSIGFAIMHYGKPMPEVYGSFIAGIALGWLAMKGRSFYPCFLLHWAISLTFDLLTIQARPGGVF